MTCLPHPSLLSPGLPEPGFAVEPGVRLRPVPEMGVCLAYTPQRPALHRLSATSWLLVSLCDGRSLMQIEVGYRAALPPGAAAATTDSTGPVAAGLAQLIALGIVTQVAPAPAPEP